MKTRDSDGVIHEKLLTKNKFDWVDCWSVDFDYESKKEFVRFKDQNGVNKETWTGNFIFENEWQSFRCKENNFKLELKNSAKKLTSKNLKIAVKVIDIFGNDTMKVIRL